MRKFSKLMPASTMKLVLSFIGVLALVAFSGFILFDATKAEVVITNDGEEQTVNTHKSTVKEVLAEVGIRVGEHDHLSHNMNDSIKNGMKIKYKQAKQVFVTINGQQTEYYTTTDTIDAFLKENNLSYHQRDDVSFTKGDAITDGLHLKIDQAYEITVNDGENQKRIWTTGGTVAEVLEQSNVAFDKDSADKVEPALNKPVTKDTVISVVRVKTEKDHVTEEMAFETEEREDSNLPKGEERVLTEGKAGKVKKVYQIVKENGKEVSRDLIDEEVVEESKNRIVAIGTKEAQQDNDLVTLANKQPKSNNKPSTVSTAKEEQTSSGNTFTMSASAYTASCGGCSGFTTTGIDLNANPNMKVIAVDPSVIPLGSRVWVEGYGEAVAGDTGGHIVGNRIDVHVPSKKAAYSWGVKTVTVKVLN
ncbi:G5 and 3D domain-containing protein [Virgibacillus pantothenticus]|uniref:G5 and 3D domain-containing protein n=1 Tax=Virgibacillus pantothenticus TaxID=1473 RepID=UPI0009862C1A|nr:G5 and 3D domain-containing protein [Virgibacillus pantothenticus]